MSENINKSSLEDLPFSFRRFKNGSISVFFCDREVTIIRGKKAEKFDLQMDAADEMEKQLLMAKITGNFKRGNERDGKMTGK